MNDRPLILLLESDPAVPDEVRKALAVWGDLRSIPQSVSMPEGLRDAALVVVPFPARAGAARLLRHLDEETEVPTLLLYEKGGTVPEGLGEFDDLAPIGQPEDVARRAGILLEFREARKKARELGLTPDDLRAEFARYGLDPELTGRHGLLPPGRVSVRSLVDVDALNRQQMAICRLMGTAYGTFLHATRPRGLRQADGEEFAPTGALSPYCAYLSAQGGRCLKAEYEAACTALISEGPSETVCEGRVTIYSAPVSISFQGASYPLLAASVAVGGVPDEQEVPEVSERYGVNQEILKQMAQESRFWVLNPDKADDIRSTFRNLAETITREVSNKYGTAWQIFRSLITEKEILNSRSVIAESHRQLEVTNRQLRAKNEEIYEVTHAITHDLRKPLASLKATIGLVRGGRLGAVPEAQVEAIDTASEATNYMTELVNDLLEAARLDAGRKVLEETAVEVRPICEKIRRRFSYVMEEGGVALELVGEPVTVLGDAGALEKVLMNLVGNSLSYIGDGERVIRIRSEARDGDGIIAVEDTGLGISEESLPHVFEKFRRGSNVAGIRGTGLGLTIVKGLVEAQGGTVELESRVGEGTTVRFRLPLAHPVEEGASMIGLTGKGGSSR